MRKTILICIVFLLIPLGIVAGQSSSGSYILERATIHSGGEASSASYRSDVVIGQQTTNFVTSNSFAMSGGFLFDNVTGVPTLVGLGSAETTQSLAPFWLLITAAITLLTIAYTRHRRPSPLRGKRNLS